MCSIPLIIKNKKDITMIIIMIITGIFKLFTSEVGDVSGMSLIVTAILYYIIS